jgi:hypothetical protein
MTSVKIKGLVITSQYGTLSDGTILRTSAEFAKHLVDDCGAAEYVEKTEKEEVKPEETPVKRKGK